MAALLTEISHRRSHAGCFLLLKTSQSPKGSHRPTVWLRLRYGHAWNHVKMP